MNSYPLVEVENESIRSIKHQNGIRLKIAKLVTMMPFSKLNKNINFKYEILNMK